jgi:hypothetical protein
MEIRVVRSPTVNLKRASNCKAVDKILLGPVIDRMAICVDSTEDIPFVLEAC